MKLTVKTLKGSHFEIRVQPTDTVMAVKKNIEDVQGKDNYPCAQQLLIHNGKVLKDETTLAANNVSEDGFLVVMLSKVIHWGACSQTVSVITIWLLLMALYIQSNELPLCIIRLISLCSTASVSDAATANPPTDTYSEAASTLVGGSNLEQTIQQIMDIGGGNWDKEAVTRALRAAYNNPERAIDYLYSGIPETAEVNVPVARVPTSQVTESGASPATHVSGPPNTSPLNMFPQVDPQPFNLSQSLAGAGAAGGLASLDFLRNNQQFQALRSMVQSNPQILQPMLQELGKQNPNLLRMIQEHHAEFLQLINEPQDGSEEEMFELPDEEMPHAINVTPAEQAAIERLEAMGFDRPLVIEAFLACDRNEELAANYLLEHAADFED
ncbi:Ubiquitin receptor RAD23b [Linum perenne]